MTDTALRPNARQIRTALRNAGVTKDRIEVVRRKGRRTVFVVTDIVEGEYGVICQALDETCAHGLSRSYNGADVLEITLRRGRA